jgi:nitroreductase
VIFSKPINQIIQERTSKRTYSLEPIEEYKKKKLKDFLSQQDYQSPFDSLINKCRFELISVPEFKPNEQKKLGTYGFIRGAQEFIVGATEKLRYHLENYGYLMEVIILAATDMGLGTCWLGGTFNRSLFSMKINCKSNEIVPAISPIGYSSDRSRFAEKIIRKVARANKRYEWNKIFFNGDFTTPLTKQNAGKYDIPLEMVHLGPSAGNKQPWRILKELDNDIFHFYIKKSKSKIGLNYSKLTHLDIGIAICHFDLTTRELEISGGWQIKEPTLTNTEEFTYIISWIGS